MMGIETLQQFIETTCATACIPIDLVKIARSLPHTASQTDFTDIEIKSNSKPFFLVIDGECCLDKLYGGYVANWICGGQWNRMVQFLTTFFHTFRSNNINVTVFLNGALELHRFERWVSVQKNCKENVVRILRHITVKGTPPPKVWWIPPVCLHSCLRMVLRHLNVNLILTSNDHHQEVVSYCQSNNCSGLMAEDVEYIVFNPSRYFSSGQLKLPLKGCLETKEYCPSEIFRYLNLHHDGVCILAALLGNHILNERDLQSFHQILCPNEKGKIPSNILITALANFVRNLESFNDITVIGKHIFGQSCKEKVEKFKMCVQYYMQGSGKCTLPFQISQGSILNKIYHCVTQKKLADVMSSVADVSLNKEHSYVSSKSSKSSKKSDSKETMSIKPENTYKKIGKAQNLQQPPNIPDEVMRIAEKRHKMGLMSPWILHILSQQEFKAPVILENDMSKEIQPILLYRHLRQMVYGILFDLNNSQYSSNTEKNKGGPPDKIPKVFIKEWIWVKGNAYIRPELIPATRLGCESFSFLPLWLEHNSDISKLRLQAFLTCLRSNSPLMTNTSYVPEHLLILCCVLRYIVSNPEVPVLQKHELDAFLAQAVDPKLTDVVEMQSMELPLVIARGVHIASLFMLGVEHAVFANDACGAPIPWFVCCPWLFFDGKLFHRKLIKASGAKNLIDLCENQIDQVAKIERMRTAILEGLDFQFAHPSMLQLDERPLPLHNFIAPNSCSVIRPANNYKGRGQKVISQGGRLEIAGVMVGSWGPNYGQNTIPPPRIASPQVVSVGGINRPSVLTCMPRGMGIKPSFSRCTATASFQGQKKKSKEVVRKRNIQSAKNSSERLPMKSIGRGCTVETDSQTVEVSQLTA